MSAAEGRRVDVVRLLIWVLICRIYDYGYRDYPPSPLASRSCIEAVRPVNSGTGFCFGLGLGNERFTQKV